QGRGSHRHLLQGPQTFRAQARRASAGGQAPGNSLSPGGGLPTKDPAAGGEGSGNRAVLPFVGRFPFPGFPPGGHVAPGSDRRVSDTDRVMPLRTLRCAVEDLEDCYPRLYLEPHSIACVAVLSQYSEPPGVFEVTCEGITSRWLGQNSTFRLEVSWA